MEGIGVEVVGGGLPSCEILYNLSVSLFLFFVLDSFIISIFFVLDSFMLFETFLFLLYSMHVPSLKKKIVMK